MHNSGQTCNAPTRMLVAQEIYDEAVEVAARAADDVAVGDPTDADDLHGPRGRPQAVRDRARLHPDRHRRGRPAGRRWPRAAGRARQGLLRPAHRVRRRHRGHARLPGGDLRTGAGDHAVQGRGARHRAGQRHRVRPLRLRAVGRPRARAPRREPHAHRHGAPQRRADRRHRAVRRLPQERQRPRVGRVRPRGLPRGQVGDGVGGLRAERVRAGAGSGIGTSCPS